MSDLRAEIKALPLHDAHTIDILGRSHKPIDQYAVLALIPEGAVLVTEDADAIAFLAKRGRVLAIVIPKGIDREDVLALQADVNARLEQMVADRGPLT